MHERPVWLVLPLHTARHPPLKMGFLAYVYHNRWLLTGAAVAVYVARTATAYYRLRQFRGPFSTGFSQIWHVGALLSWKPQDKYREACDKYGTEAFPTRVDFSGMSGFGTGWRS